MYAKSRKIYNLSGTKAIPIPDGTPTGEMASVAMDKLLLIDPMGEFEPEELLVLLGQLEPDIWASARRRARRTAATEAGFG